MYIHIYIYTYIYTHFYQGISSAFPAPSLLSGGVLCLSLLFESQL